jgi:NADH:ubiquinone oxidoreductase subunit E
MLRTSFENKCSTIAVNEMGCPGKCGNGPIVVLEDDCGEGPVLESVTVGSEEFEKVVHLSQLLL